MEAGTGGILANNMTNFPDSLKFYKCGIVLGRNELGPGIRHQRKCDLTIWPSEY